MNSDMKEVRPMTSRNRRVNHPWARTQAGETALSALIGAFIGALILSGFMAFWISTSDSGTNNAESAKQEAAATETLNRIRRDIQDSTSILKATDSEVVLDRKSKAGGTIRTFYRVVGTGDDARVERGLRAWSGAAAPSMQWPDEVETIASKVAAAETKFTYQNRKAEPVTSPVVNPTEVRLVKIKLTSKTPKGRFPLESAAAIDTGRGGASGPTARNYPDAADDVVTVKTGESATVDILANDSAGVTIITAPAINVPGVTFTSLGGGRYRVLASDTATPTDGVPHSSVYEVENADGVAAATLYVHVRRAAQPANANPDSVAVRVDDTLTPGMNESVRDVNVLANDDCDDDNGRVVGCATLPASAISVSLGPVPTAIASHVTATVVNRQIRVSVSESFAATPRTFKLDYSIVDERPDSSSDSSSHVTVTVGPSVLNDTVTAMADESSTVNLLSNDRYSGASGALNVSFLAGTNPVPEGIAYNASTGVLTWSPAIAGTHVFKYRVTDSTGLYDEGTITAVATPRPAPVAVRAGAWDVVDVSRAQNRIDLSGGQGDYRLYASTSVDASGNPVSPITVCSPCAGTTYHTVGLGTQYHYFAFDSRTSGSNWASMKSDLFGSDLEVLTFPGETTIWVGGSDVNRDSVADAVGMNQIFWWGDVVGLRAHTFDGTETTSTSTNLGAVTKTTCVAYGGDGCYRHTGRARGSETAYSSYGLNQCKLHPSSPRPRTGGYCASPRRELASISYSDAKAPGVMGAATSATNDKVAVRAVQLPAAPSASQRYNVASSDSGVNQTLGNDAPDTCDDRAESLTNGLYSCDANTATVRWLVDGDDAKNDLWVKTGHCDRPENNGQCYGQLRLNATANASAFATGGTVVANRVASPWDSAAAKSDCYGITCAQLQATTVAASTTDTVDSVVATACNQGGCASGPLGTLTSYPATPTFTQVYSNPRQYVFFVNNVVADDGEAEGTAANCWTPTTHPAACRYRGDSQSTFTFSDNNPVHYRVTNSVMTPASPTNIYSLVKNGTYSWTWAWAGSVASGGKYVASVTKILFPGYSNKVTVDARSIKTGLIQTSATRSLRPPLPNVGMMMGSPIVRGDTLAYGWKYASLWRSVSHYRADAGATNASGATYSLYPTRWVWHQWSGHDSTSTNRFNECVSNPNANPFCGTLTAQNTPRTGGYGYANVSWNSAYTNPRSTNSWTGTFPSHPTSERAGSGNNTWTTGSHYGVHWSATMVMDQPKITSGSLAGLPVGGVHDNILGGDSYSTLWMPFNQNWRASNFWQSWTQHSAGDEPFQSGFSALRMVTHKYTRSTGASYGWDGSSVYNSQKQWCDVHPINHPNDSMKRCFPNSIPTDTWATAVGGKFTVKEATEGNNDNVSPNPAIPGGRGWYQTALGWYNG